ncbi:hypothetical protein D3C79_784720 [compost metagenome]
MLNILFPAFAEQGLVPVVIATGLDEQFIGLQVATAWPINGNPIGVFLTLIIGGQGRNQLAIPEVRVGVIETMRTGSAEINGQYTHVIFLRG